MAQPVMTDQLGVRFGVGNGVLFLLTGLAVVGRVPGAYGVGLLLVATAVLAAALDRRHALGLGLAGWALATGFAVHTLGVLTFAAPDLLRLVVFMATAAATSRIRART